MNQKKGPIGAKMNLRSVTNLVKDEKGNQMIQKGNRKIQKGNRKIQKGNRKIQSLLECKLMPMGK